MSNTILFCDANVTDYETLIAALGGEVEVHLLNVEEDGVLQMATILQGRSGLDSIQILSHGSSGSLFLGSSVLNNDNLASYRDALSQIGSTLSETGDLLLYGCNVAQGEAGVRFIDRLAQYTGADVAASTNLTGASVLWGDWVMEISSGVIEAPLLVADKYAYTLTSDVVNVNVAPTLNAFTSVVASGDEDSQITVTFANLQAQGDEADVDGTSGSLCD